MNEIEKLRNLLEAALGMLRAIEFTNDDNNLRDLAGNAYSEIPGQLCELAAEPKRQELLADEARPFLAAQDVLTDGFCVGREAFEVFGPHRAGHYREPACGIQRHVPATGEKRYPASISNAFFALRASP